MTTGKWPEEESFCCEVELLKGLVESTKCSLPSSYVSIRTRLNTVVEEIKLLREQSKLSGPYIKSLLVNQIHEVLHECLDAAEEQVLRGTVLSGDEIRLCNEISSIYDNLLEQFALNSSDTDTTEVSTAFAVLSYNPGDQNHVHHVNESNEETPGSLEEEIVRSVLSDAYEDRTLDPSILWTRHARYMVTASEEVLCWGVAVSLDSEPLRMHTVVLSSVRLTHGPLFGMQANLYTVQLSDITSVTSGTPSNTVILTTDVGKTTLAFQNASDWLAALQNACKLPREEESTTLGAPETNKNSYDAQTSLSVQVRAVEDLRGSKKGRDDHPYFVLGVTNPERFGSDRLSRHRSKKIKCSRNPEFNETLDHLQVRIGVRPPMLDLRLYSRVKKGNDFCYGVVTMDLPIVDNTVDHSRPQSRVRAGTIGPQEASGWYDVVVGRGRVHGRVHLSVRVLGPPIQMMGVLQRGHGIPEICSGVSGWVYTVSGVRAMMGGGYGSVGRVEVIDSDQQGGGALLRWGGDRNTRWLILEDRNSGREVMRLERGGGLLKREWVVMQEGGHAFARCYHKVKSFRKKKLRMFLTETNELLMTMEGGCFDTKQYNNEVYVQNSVGDVLASVVFCTQIKQDAVVHIVDELVDRSLVMMFALYAVVTW